MKVYSPIKAGGSILGKPENQLSQIISIHPDVAAESGEKLLIADGSYYNAYDKQVSELKNIYGIEELNNLGTESSVLTLDLGSASSSDTEDDNINTAFFENNNGDKYIVAWGFNDVANEIDYTKFAIYRMLNNETVFTFYKNIDFETNIPFLITSFSYNTSLKNRMHFNPETNQVNLLDINPSNSVYYYFNVADGSVNYGVFGLTIPVSLNIDYLMTLNNTFIGHFDYKTNTYIAQLRKRTTSGNFYKVNCLLKHENNSFIYEELGVYRYYRSESDYNLDFLDDDIGSDGNEIGYAIRDNSNNIIFTSKGASNGSRIIFSYSERMGGMYNNEIVNTHFSQKDGSGAGYFNKFGNSTLVLTDCYQDAQTGTDLNASAPVTFCYLLDKKFDSKMLFAYTHSTIASEFQYSSESFNIGYPEITQYLSNENIHTINFPDEQRNDGLNSINVFISDGSVEDINTNSYYPISIVFDNINNELIKDGKTFTLEGEMAIKHLTGNYFVLSNTSSSNAKEYAIIRLSLTNANFYKQAGYNTPSDIEVIKISNGFTNSNIGNPNNAQFYFDEDLISGNFEYYFNNYQTIAADNKKVDLMFSEDQLGERVLIPDRTAYNDPNGLSKDYIIKSVKGIKGTTTGE